MFERSQRALKVLCGVLGALVLYRLGLFVVHINPLYHVTIPALPVLASAAAPGNDTNAANAGMSHPTAGSNLVRQASTGKGTNQSAQASSTNLASSSSNSVARATNTVVLATNALRAGSNVVALASNLVVHPTNAVVAQATNSGATNRDGHSA